MQAVANGAPAGWNIDRHSPVNNVAWINNRPVESVITMNSQAGEPVDVGSATASISESSDTLSRLFGEHHRRVLTAAYRITGNQVTQRM
jgi:hypothetical protein